MKRASGILLPIFSLPSKYGIGTLGKEAYKFIDFLVDTKQKYWQLLPIMETSFGNSPYSATSNLAGNPLFIDLDMLKDDGLLDESDYADVDFGNDERRVNYYKLHENRYKILKIATDNYRRKHPLAFFIFKLQNNFYLDDYATFHAIKDMYGGASFDKWDTAYRDRDKKTIAKFTSTHKEEIEFYKATQCLFYLQWFKLKKYANANGIKLIGDTPIYSAYDSADVWAHPEFFYLNENKTPIEVSGCPPDAYSIKGQLWGNPLYNYDYIKEHNFEYFIEKYKQLFTRYDVIRIDHFRGFDSYYSIPYGASDASVGKWVDAPGSELFKKLKEEIKDLQILAEDLGFLTESVHKLLEETGFPGMKVLQFGFDSRDRNNSEYLPHTYPENSAAYIGTHDNDTFVGWFNSITDGDREYAKEYLSLKCDGQDHFRAIKTLFETKSKLAVITLQDLLGIGSEGRINTPSTISDNNWSYRIKLDEIDEDTKLFLKNLTVETNRAR